MGGGRPPDTDGKVARRRVCICGRSGGLPFLGGRPNEGGLAAVRSGRGTTRFFSLFFEIDGGPTQPLALNYAILAQEHRCGELIEVAPADIKGYRATVRTTKKGMRLQSQIEPDRLLNTSPARPFN